MKRSLICLIELGSLTATVVIGCFYLLPLSPVSPKSTVQVDVSCSSESKAQAEQVQVLSTHRWSQGIVVLYSALCPTGNKAQLQPIFGHQVVKQKGKNWQVSGSDNYGIEKPETLSEKLIYYSTSKSINQGSDRYTILYGQILKPKVTAVEATFDNGKVLRDESDSGVFALISPGSTAVCELRVLGIDNQILQQEDLTASRRFTLKKTSLCLNASRQS